MTTEYTDNTSVVVIGASGDLARRKIFPALFALYCQGLLGKQIRFFGFARSRMDNDAFRESIKEHLTCRYTPGEATCAKNMEEFLARCSYVSGQYGQADSFRELDRKLSEAEGDTVANRIFYLAIPPSIFADVARALAEAGMSDGGPDDSWPRVVIEKPFGRDRISSDKLSHAMASVFSEDQTYRIDHYLGKEVIQNLMALRFANLIFEPIWNRLYIKNVQILWGETIGTEGRGGYFDNYGIIRDVMQNHLLQILSLVAMEQPVGLSSNYVRDEKVKILRSISPVKLEDLVVGQYIGSEINNTVHKGYRQEPDVPESSRTPTYAAAALSVKSRRWDGVPFLLRAGKGLEHSLTEICIQFREVAGSVFSGLEGTKSPNRLVIRVQPDEGILFRIANKVPGLDMELALSNLRLHYDSAFQKVIPDAYERLLMDVFNGDKSLFIREDELQAAWDIFTPALHQLEQQALEPKPYPFGSSGPKEGAKLATRYGVVCRHSKHTGEQ